MLKSIKVMLLGAVIISSLTLDAQATNIQRNTRDANNNGVRDDIDQYIKTGGIN